MHYAQGRGHETNRSRGKGCRDGDPYKYCGVICSVAFLGFHLHVLLHLLKCFLQLVWIGSKVKLIKSLGPTRV